MTDATSYLNTVTKVQDDISTISGVSEELKSALGATKKVLEVPGKLEKQLREPADAMDLPDPLVAVLGLTPFGIGNAIKTIDKIGEKTADVINEQADIMGTLDQSWSTPRKVVKAVETANSALSGAAAASTFRNGQMQKEASRLEDSLGGQQIADGFDLKARMEHYQEHANDWFEVRDAILSPFETASHAFEKALNELRSALPDTGAFEDALDAVGDVMQPISDAAHDLKDLICREVTITPEVVIPGTPAITITPAIPPIYGTNPFTGNKFLISKGIPAVVIPAIPETVIPAVKVDICKALADAQSKFDAIIEAVINDALALIGVDFKAMAKELQDKLLAPLKPILDAIDTLKAEAEKVIAKLTEKLEPLLDGMGDMMAALERATTVASLFDNTIIGDKAGGPEDLADILTGTDSEDAIFGMGGNDHITGGGGDFLFGGKGNDLLVSAGDELYGGEGRDRLKGSKFTDKMDGGTGNDKLIGRSGNDLLNGGEGSDVLSGGGGNDDLDGGSGADRIRGGNGQDRIIGGEGNDKLKGGSGSDTFVFANNSGTDKIQDFDADDNNEKIDLAAVAAIRTWKDLQQNHLTQNGLDTVIEDGDNTQIVLRNVDMNDLDRLDFIF